MSRAWPKLIGHTCLTAGAGAGKTRRLVETYLGLLAEGVAPQQIVAITFTEKAAAEMRTRVVAQLAALAGAREPGPDWRRLLPQVEWAPISTIHGFCASLLREFGAAMGLDPEFRIMEAEELEELKAQCLDGILREHMQKGSSQLAALGAHYPLTAFGGLRQRISMLYDQLSSLGVTAELAQERSARAHQHELKRAPDLIAQLNIIIGKMAALRAGDLAKGKQKFLIKLDELLRIWPGLQQTLAVDPADLQAIQTLHPLCGGNWGKLANPLRKECRAALDDLSQLAHLPLATELTGLLLSLVRQLEERMRIELQRRAALGFDGLLLAGRSLVRDYPGVLKELRGRWQALLVDEYQDVNPVQGELVGLLAGLRQPPGYTADSHDPLPRLLVVGDRKQSIYGFRGAEVSLYARTMQEFEQGQGRVEALPNNWRSAHRLVEFFNRLFPQVFASGALRGQAADLFVDYRPDDTQTPARQKPGPTGACVELLQVQGPEQWTSQDWRREEAKNLGCYLAGLIHEQGVNPGHIAVLFRRLTQVDLYEDALNQAGVDYYTLRGRGYFACQEIKDIYYGLRAAVYPQDELALAVWLRSPMVGLSDEALLALSYPEPDRRVSLNHCLQINHIIPNWLDDVDRKSLESARAHLRGLRSMAKRLTPAELMERVVDYNGYFVVMSSAAGGEQKAANIRKLIEMSRQPGWDLQGGVEEFIAGLGKLVESPPAEPKASLLGEEAHVVRLMTVHQSKGLEFPIVVLPDLAGKDALYSILPPPDKTGVVSLVPRDFATDALLKNPIYAHLRASEQASQEAESARLFYVACTRATEKLVFCLNDAPPAKQSAWGNWVRDLVVEDPETRLVESDEPTEITDDSSSSPYGAAAGPEDEALARQITRRCLHPAAPLARRLRESVSGIEDWFNCPRRYYFARVLGLDTAVLSGWDGKGGGAGAEGAGNAASLGSQVHRLLELAPLWQGPSGLDQVLHQAAPADAAPRVRGLAAGIWQTGLASLLQDLPPGNILREQSFTLLIESGFESITFEIMGEIDLLLVRPEGLVLVDYKVSGRVEPQKYRLQLGMYALAAWRMQAKQDSPPRCAICYLKDSGPELLWQEFSPAQLDELEDKIRRAAVEIARLPLRPMLSDFDRGRACSNACELARAGLCKAKE